MTELKPCPFCGKEVAEVLKLGEHGKDFVNPNHFEVVCNFHKGGCGATCGGEYETEEEAIDAWNRRVKDAVPVVPGRWILEREPNGKPYCFHCSVCDGDFHYIGIKSATKYCPNCGAKMDVEGER